MSKKVPHAVSRELRMNIVGLLSIVPRNVKVVEGEPNSKHREAAEESIDGQGMFAEVAIYAHDVEYNKIGNDASLAIEP